MVSDLGSPAKEGRQRFGLSAWRILRLLLVLAVIAGALWYLRDFDFQALRASLMRTRWGYLFAAALLNLGVLTIARALRWRALLPHSPATGRRPPLLFLTAVTLEAFAASNVLPFRAGEALRTASLRERCIYPVGNLVAVQVLEKLVEAVSMATFALPIALWLRPAALPAVASVVAGGAVIAYGVSRLARTRLRQMRRPWVRQLADAVASLESRRAWLISLGWALLADAVDVAMIGLCITAVGLHVSLLGWCAILVGVNVATLLPGIPGQLGVLEAGAVVVLTGLGVNQPASLAFALLYHGAHWLPTTFGGGLVLAAGELGRWRGTFARRPDERLP